MSSDRTAAPLDALLARALQLNAEVEGFKARWGAVAPEQETCPTFTWEELERQLVDLAPTDLQAELAHKLVARTKAYARLKPPEMVLREILGIAALLLEEADLEAVLKDD